MSIIQVKSHTERFNTGIMKKERHVLFIVHDFIAIISEASKSLSRHLLKEEGWDEKINLIS